MNYETARSSSRSGLDDDDGRGTRVRFRRQSPSPPHPGRYQFFYFFVLFPPVERVRATTTWRNVTWRVAAGLSRLLPIVRSFVLLSSSDDCAESRQQWRQWRTGYRGVIVPASRLSPSFRIQIPDICGPRVERARKKPRVFRRANER